MFNKKLDRATWYVRYLSKNCYITCTFFAYETEPTLIILLNEQVTHEPSLRSVTYTQDLYTKENVIAWWPWPMVTLTTFSSSDLNVYIYDRMMTILYAFIYISHCKRYSTTNKTTWLIQTLNNNSLLKFDCLETNFGKIINSSLRKILHSHTSSLLKKLN